MIAWRIFAFLALAFSVQGGEDLNLVYKLLDCCQRAILEGVPAIPLPTHNPLVVPHEINSSGVNVLTEYNLTAKNIVWYGLPQWELKKSEQLSDDKSPYAAFLFDIYWKSFNMSIDYVLDTRLGFVSTSYSGQLILNWTHTDWAGSINFTKPGFNLTEGINDLQLEWPVKDIKAQVTGLGILNAGAGLLISSTLTNFLNNVLGTGLSPFLVSRVNDFWLGNSTRVPILLDWCDSTANY